MPADESPEQHTKRRTEETAEVEKDKNNPAGLFKGTFAKTRGGRLYQDEEDGVTRCGSCNHEYEGGPACANCGAVIHDGYDFSDLDDDDDLDTEDLEQLDHLEFDLDDDEVNGEYAHMRGHHQFGDIPDFGAPIRPMHYGHQFHHPAVLHEAIDLSNSDGSGFTDSEDENNSLSDFVVPDDEPIRAPNRRGRVAHTQRLTIDLTSDDDSDEGGAISNGRARRRRESLPPIPPPAVPDALSISSDDDTHESDFDETLSEAEQRLQRAGWSPLDNGADSELELHDPYRHDYAGYDATEDDDDQADDRSDTTNTSTIDGNPMHYHEAVHRDEDDLSDSSNSETPTYRDDPYIRPRSPYSGGYGDYAGQYQYLGEEEDDDEVANGYSTGASAAMDRDGDTDMSASSSRSRSSSSVTPNAYATAYNEEYYSRGDRDISEPVTDYGADQILEADYHLREVRDVSEQHTDYDDDQEPHGDFQARGSRNVSEQRTDYGDDRDPDDASEYDGYEISHTYVANAVHEPEPEAESSDSSSIRPPNRRQPRQPRHYSAPDREAVRVHNYYRNPFVPSFTEPRQNRERGSLRDPIWVDGAGDDWEGEIRRVIEPSSRTRRMTAYRDMPARRIDPLRSSRSPSASRIMSSSHRASRYPTQYSRR